MRMRFGLFHLIRGYEKTYDDFIISSDDYYFYESMVYEFVLKNKQRLLSPFNTRGKYNIISGYDEYRPLRNTTSNSTYLYKSFIPQPQNCEYENAEIEKMKIKTSFEYKEIYVIHPKSDRNNPLLRDEKTKEENKEYYKSINSGPMINQWYSKNDANSKEDSKITVIHYPKELAKIWETAAKEIRDIIKKKILDPEGLSLIKELGKENIDFASLLKRLSCNIVGLRHLHYLQTNLDNRLPMTSPYYNEEAKKHICV
jgi:hypothetical protein